MRPWFEKGANLIAAQESQAGIGGVVHGDFKIDNLVSSLVVAKPIDHQPPSERFFTLQSRES